MTPAPTLNHYAPGTWARVVSAVTWAGYTLGADGTFTAKLTRGPLIVWATKSGEGASLEASGPAVSALEARAWAVNTAAHFERFRKAAHGFRKVRRVMRKTWGGKVCRKAFVSTLQRVMEWVATQGLIFDIWQAADGNPAGPRWSGGLRGRPADRTAKGRREARREWESERFHDRLRDIAPAHWEDEDGQFTGGYDAGHVRFLAGLARGVGRVRSTPSPRQPLSACDELRYLEAADKLMPFAVATRDRRAIAGLLSILKAQRITLALTLALRALEAAAYRAHLSRRVRPPSRRTRIKRPLYARPRPPNCPLAPPVA